MISSSLLQTQLLQRHLCLLGSLLFCSSISLYAATTPPNVIVILADDMGIGDVSHHGGKAPTPHIDRLAKEGMRFSDAHTSSSVCTPTRYSLLTGRYNWRSRLKKGVFSKPSDKPLIKPNEFTLATLFKDHDYHTACIGKWHLGIGWQFLDSPEKQAKKKGLGWDIDYSKPATTPTAHGFDYFFGIQASLDMAPYVYLENQRATKPATVVKAFHRPGAAAVDFEANQCLKTWAEKSAAYIDQRATEPKQPFFLYLPLTSPHTPIVPSKAWQGKSSIGSYGDFLMETDWVVGEVLKALDRNKLADNTLVIFTTDNGCSPAAKIPNLVSRGHQPNGSLRGHKADIYEGGHRVPFIARWPDKIKAGTTSSRTLCQTDIAATCATLLEHQLAASDAPDSVSFLPTLLSNEQAPRSATVHHSFNGSFAIRDGKWKLCLCPGSGGWSSPKPAQAWKNKDLPIVQLYDLNADPSETTNLANQHPEKVQELVKQLANIIHQGRSTPGSALDNDGAVPFPKALLTRFPELAPQPQ